MDHLRNISTGGRLNSTYIKKLAWVAEGIAIWDGVTGVWESAKTYRNGRKFSIKIDSRDEIFPWVQREVMRRLPRRAQKSIEVVTQRGDDADDDEIHHTNARRETRVLRTYFTGERPERVNIGGHSIRVSVVKPELGGTEQRVVLTTPSMYFSCDTQAARDAVLEMLRAVTEEYEKTRVGSRLWVAARWGDWQREPSIPTRSIDTVILAPGQVNDMVTDLEKFMRSEAHYNRMGVPWHRGFALHGPPGTGKTSVARGLSDHFGLDLYYLPLHDVEQDTDLMSMVSKVKARSILLIEDIDISSAARERTDKKPGVSMTGLLNALDGVATPHGLIKIMTSNALESVDDAMIRPGRADRIFEIDYVVDGQFEALIELMTGEPVTVDLPSVKGRKLTPAQVIEWAKPHLGDPEMITKVVLENIR